MKNYSLDMIVSDLQKINPMITKGKIRIAYPDKNRKKYDIPREVFEDAMPTLMGSPVVAYFFNDGEIGGHEGDISKDGARFRKTGEPIPYGFVSGEKPYWEEYEGKEYFSTTIYLWTGRYKESEKILKSSQSMEILIGDAELVDGYVYVKKMYFSGLCALGDGVTPTFEGSQFEKFSNDEAYISTKKEIEDFMEEFSSDPTLSCEWLCEMIEDINIVFGVDTNSDEANELYEEFKDYNNESFATPKKYDHINFKPPATVAKEAQRGLDMRAKQPDSNKCCTPVGLARARQLVNRQELSPSTVRRMKSFFDRHEVDKQSKSWKDGESKAEQSWKIWGSDAGYRWAKKIVAQMDKADKEKFAMDNVKVSTDGKKAIEGNVGDKDLSAMKRKVMNAPNRASVIKKIYARHPEDVSGSLNLADIGYPLMSERDGVFYYNRGFIKAASSRIEQNKDQPYYSKVRSRIVDARKKVGMQEQFNFMKGQCAMDMMKKMAMDMFEKYGMRYMPYAMDDMYMYAMDTEKDMAKMRIPYAMKEDETMAMDYEKMMAMDYEDVEMAIKTVMGMLKEKMMLMEEEKMGMMEKYSDAEKELEKVKASLTSSEEKLEKYSNLEKEFDEEKAKVLQSVIDMKASLEEKDVKIKDLTDKNEKFSLELEKIESEKKDNEIKAIVEKEIFSCFTADEKQSLIEEYKECSVEDFEIKIQSKAFSKYMANEAFSSIEPSTFSTMSNHTNKKKEDDEDDGSKDTFDRL